MKKRSRFAPMVRVGVRRHHFPNGSQILGALAVQNTIITHLILQNQFVIVSAIRFLRNNKEMQCLFAFEIFAFWNPKSLIDITNRKNRTTIIKNKFVLKSKKNEC